MKYTKEERLNIGRRIYNGEISRYQAAEEYDPIKGVFSHMGGVGVAKYVKAHMGSAYFERLLAAASSGLVSAAG